MTDWYKSSWRHLKTGLLINPLGGSNRKQLKRLLRTAGACFDLTNQATTPQEVARALEKFAGQGVNLVAISGGDGTVQAALTVLFGKKPFDMLPPLIILPGGTANLIAKDVGISGNQQHTMKRLQRLVSIEKAGVRASLIKRPVIRLGRAGKRSEYGMFSGAASLYQAVSFYQKWLEDMPFFGRARIFLSALTLIWADLMTTNKNTASGLNVTVDGKNVSEKRFVLLLVTTLERLFFGLKPFRDSGSGPLHLLAVRKRPKHLLEILSLLLTGRFSPKLIPENGYHLLDASKIEILTERGVALDGQIFRPARSGQPIFLDCGGYVTFMRL